MEWGDIMRRERPSRRFCGNSEGAEIVKGQDGHLWNPCAAGSLQIECEAQ